MYRVNEFIAVNVVNAMLMMKGYEFMWNDFKLFESLELNFNENVQLIIML